MNRLTYIQDKTCHSHKVLRYTLIKEHMNIKSRKSYTGLFSHFFFFAVSTLQHRQKPDTGYINSYKTSLHTFEVHFKILKIQKS